VFEKLEDEVVDADSEVDDAELRLVVGRNIKHCAERGRDKERVEMTEINVDVDLGGITFLHHSSWG
jgi:hypothetical protein